MLQTVNAFPEPAQRAAPQPIEETVAQCRRRWRDLGLTTAPRVQWHPRPVLPHSTLVGQLFELASGEDVDAILFAEERHDAPLNDLRDTLPNLQCLLIDLGGNAGLFADVYFALNDRSTWDNTAKAILAHRERRAQLQPGARSSDEPEMQLLAHLFAVDRDLRAVRYPATPEAICYPGAWSTGRTVPVAEALARQGYLKKTFYDRMHECSQCQSRRLNVREECPSCRCADLVDTELIHHYHCATLLPEAEFREGTTLVCPKCRQQLRNYGKDYDKPGRAMMCQACGGATSEPEVGFVCLDCDATTDGDAIKRTDVFSYALTETGIAYLTTPSQQLSVIGLPASLLAEIERMRAANAVEVAIAEVKYGARDSIVGMKGEPVFDKLRRLFLESMTNYLSGAASLHRGDEADYFVMSRADDDLVAEMSALLERSDAVLAERLEPNLRLAIKSVGA